MNRYNTFWQRVGAAIIDGIVVGFLIIGLQLFSAFDKSTSIFFYDFFSDALTIIYSVFLHGKFGQTVGKMLFKIKVVEYENESKAIGYYKSIKRDSIWIILTVISYLPYFNELMFFDYVSVFWFLLEIFTTLFNEKRRAVHDYLANSVVIDIRSYTKWETAFYTKQKVKMESNDR